MHNLLKVQNVPHPQLIPKNDSRKTPNNVKPLMPGVH